MHRARENETMKGILTYPECVLAVFADPVGGEEIRVVEVNRLLRQSHLLLDLLVEWLNGLKRSVTKISKLNRRHTI